MGNGKVCFFLYCNFCSVLQVYLFIAGQGQMKCNSNYCIYGGIWHNDDVSSEFSMTLKNPVVSASEWMAMDYTTAMQNLDGAVQNVGRINGLKYGYFVTKRKNGTVHEG